MTVFLKWFQIKVTNIQVISEITTHNFSVTPFILGQVHSYCCPTYICISVLANLRNIDCFAIFFTILIVLLIWKTLPYTCISFSVSSTVHKCFQSSFCPLLLLCKFYILMILSLTGIAIDQLICLCSGPCIKLTVRSPVINQAAFFTRDICTLSRTWWGK